MNKSKKFSEIVAVAALLLLVATGSAFAQTNVSREAALGSWADTTEIDLATAVDIALSESPSVKIADKEITKKEYYRRQQQASLLPNLSLGGSYSRALQKQVMALDIGGETNKIEVGTDNTWGAGLNLSLPVVAPALWKTVQLTKLDIELAYESSRASKIATIGGVKNAYYSLLMAQDSYDVLLASYQNAEFNARIANDKYNQGLVSEFDKLRADVVVRNLRPGLVAAENGVKLAIMQLKVLMGVDVDEKIRFTGKLLDYQDQMRSDLGYLAADTTLEANTDLKQIDIQARQLIKAREITHATYLPTLMLTGNYQWSSLNNDFRIGHYQWNPYSMVGLTLNVPIFEGRGRWAKDKQNKIGIEQLALQREDVMRSLELQVRNSLNNIEKAIEEIGSNEQSIIESQKAFTISQRRYEVGSGSLLELNDSELALTRARLAFNQSIFNYLSEKAILEKTLGTAQQ